MGNLFSSFLFLSLLLSSLFSLSLSCSDDDLTGGRTFRSCLDLKLLGASIHWTHFPANGSASFAFKVQSDGWAAWGPNLGKGGMIGTQAFIAGLNGTSGVSFFATNLTSEDIVKLSPGEISVRYSSFSAEYINGKYVIYVNIVLPGNGTSIKHTWQTGTILPDGGFGFHSFVGDHDRSFGTLNLATVTKSAPGPGSPGPAPAHGSPSSAPAPGSPSSAPAPGSPSSPPGKNGGEIGRKIGFASYVLLVAGILLF